MIIGNKLRTSCTFFKTWWIHLKLFNRPSIAFLMNYVSFSSAIVVTSFFFRILIMRANKLSISTSGRLLTVIINHFTKLTHFAVMVAYFLTSTTRCLRSISLLIRRIRLLIFALWRINLAPASLSLLWRCHTACFWFWIFVLLFWIVNICTWITILR